MIEEFVVDMGSETYEDDLVTLSNPKGVISFTCNVNEVGEAEFLLSFAEGNEVSVGELLFKLMNGFLTAEVLSQSFNNLEDKSGHDILDAYEMYQSENKTVDFLAMLEDSDDGPVICPTDVFSSGDIESEPTNR
jgi:hypothetical protein